MEAFNLLGAANGHYFLKSHLLLRADHRCSDVVFILKTIIDQTRSSKQSLFCSFLDFSRAFDTIPRHQFSDKLSKLGTHGKMLSTIKSLYNNVQVVVKTPSGLTNLFESEIGVKQGCPLSPTLFGLYIDELESVLLKSSVDAPQLLDYKVPVQIFTDDSQLLSTSPQGLQASLDKMQIFCEEHGLKIM